jgi:hypothetical protein
MHKVGHKQNQQELMHTKIMNMTNKIRHDREVDLTECYLHVFVLTNFITDNRYDIKYPQAVRVYLVA